jgi:hypothetical protein
MATILTDVVEISFENESGSLAQKRGNATFGSLVKQAQVALRGFSMQLKHEKKIQEITVEVDDVVVESNSVSFQASFGIKDGSGHFDDPFSGNVSALVIATAQD